jgi:thiol:disulfide interchange protein DsbC
MKLKSLFAVGVGAAVWLAASMAWAQEAEIRKNFSARLANFPQIDEIRRTPMPGIWEVRIGTQFFYTDAEANFVIEGGDIVDLRTRKSYTQERMDVVTAVKFADLPLADAMVIKQGKGTRKLAVFSDPYCGPCRQLERELAKLKDVTLYMFLMTGMSPESMPRAKDVLCTKDPGVSWRAMMIDGEQPPAASADCAKKQTSPERVRTVAQKLFVSSTPTLVLESGSRVRGAMPAAMLEERLAAAPVKDAKDAVSGTK